MRARKGVAEHVSESPTRHTWRLPRVMATFIRRFSERKPTTRCGFERTREMMIAWNVAGRDQSPSEAIRGHQRPSEAIRGHQRPSEAIRGHQRPSEAIRSTHLLFAPLESVDGANLER